MALETHTTSEMGKTVAVLIAIVAFVVIMLTKVPEWIAPQGGIGGSDVGRTVKMIK
jgi:hypothetical protein